MRPGRLRAASAFMSFLALAFVFATVSVDAAQRGPAPGPLTPALATASPPMPMLREEVAVPVNEVRKLIEYKDFVGALVRLFDADMVSDKTPFEEYTVAKYLGLIFVNQPMPDLEAARGAYNRQVASHGCPDEEQASMYEVAVRLNAAAMDDADVVLDALDLSKRRPLDGAEVLALAAAYLRLRDFPNAAVAAKAGIDAETAASMPPDPELLRVFKDAEAKLDEK